MNWKSIVSIAAAVTAGMAGGQAMFGQFSLLEAGMTFLAALVGGSLVASVQTILRRRTRRQDER